MSPLLEDCLDDLLQKFLRDKKDEFKAADIDEADLELAFAEQISCDVAMFVESLDWGEILEKVKGQ